MGLLSGIKNKLGIGGVKVTLHVPGQVAKDAGSLAGKITLTTKSEQEIVDLTVTFIEEFSSGRGDNKTTKEIDLGMVKLPGGFSLSPGESKEIPFTLPFEIAKSDMDNLAEKGGALGALGKMGKFASKESSEYFVDAECDVKSAAFDPSDKKEIRIV